MKRSRERTGFTLIEVMLTTVLATVLLLALWSLLSMYSKTFEEGHSRTEEAQLGRVLLEQISSDLRNVLVSPTAGGEAAGLPAFAPADEATPPGPARLASPPTLPPIGSRPLLGAAIANAATAPAMAGTSLPTDSADAANTTSTVRSSLRPAGLFGTSTFMQIDVVQPAMLAPRREPGESTFVDPQEPVGAEEIKTVVYSFEEYRDPANPLAEAGTRLIRRELSWAEAHPARDSEPGVAAARNDFGGSLGPTGVAADASRSSAAPAEIIASDRIDEKTLGEESLGAALTIVPEVSEFTFRYFDGALWSEEWDSIARRSLPVAVEVSLRLRSLDDRGSPTSRVDVAAGLDQQKIDQLKHPLQRMLIPLPFVARPTNLNPEGIGAGSSAQQNSAGADSHAGIAP